VPDSRAGLEWTRAGRRHLVKPAFEGLDRTHRWWGHTFGSGQAVAHDRANDRNRLICVIAVRSGEGPLTEAKAVVPRGVRTRDEAFGFGLSGKLRKTRSIREPQGLFPV
jgi:hypothetical protein